MEQSRFRSFAPIPSIPYQNGIAIKEEPVTYTPATTSQIPAVVPHANAFNDALVARGAHHVTPSAALSTTTQREIKPSPQPLPQPVYTAARLTASGEVELSHGSANSVAAAATPAAQHGLPLPSQRHQFEELDDYKVEFSETEQTVRVSDRLRHQDRISSWVDESIEATLKGRGVDVLPDQTRPGATRHDVSTRSQLATSHLHNAGLVPRGEATQSPNSSRASSGYQTLNSWGHARGPVEHHEHSPSLESRVDTPVKRSRPPLSYDHDPQVKRPMIADNLLYNPDAAVNGIKKLSLDDVSADDSAQNSTQRNMHQPVTVSNDSSEQSHSSKVEEKLLKDRMHALVIKRLKNKVAASHNESRTRAKTHEASDHRHHGYHQVPTVVEGSYGDGAGNSGASDDEEEEDAVSRMLEHKFTTYPRSYKEQGKKGPMDLNCLFETISSNAKLESAAFSTGQ